MVNAANGGQFKPLLAAFIVMSALAGLSASVATRAGVPRSTSQINIDQKGVALGGYDPVAYFDSGKPTRGTPAIFASYHGARYLFETVAHRETFLKNPAKYVPEFGGFCVVGAAFGEKVDVDPGTGKVVNGKLYLNNSERSLEIFEKDESGTIAKAESHWPTVKDKPL